MTPNEFVIIFTTLPADSDPAEFANALVEERLAACVSIYGDMQSFYRWSDQVEQDTERQVVIKTAARRVPALWERVRAMHPYEVPEFLVMPIVDGNEAYLSWMRESTVPGEEG
jgi:periplasmic divalent cation tolerance protein